MKSELQPAALKDDGESTEKKPSLDNRYHFDEAKLNELRKESPWTKDPKYFTSCSLSPSAVMKMMMHCQSGVKKGIDKGGNPIEVMGLLMGRPDHETPKTLVITDAFPLPIEGFETRVIADDQDVVNHMIALGECLERTRKEKFMGWYVILLYYGSLVCLLLLVVGYMHWWCMLSCRQDVLLCLCLLSRRRFFTQDCKYIIILSIQNVDVSHHVTLFMPLISLKTISSQVPQSPV
jgi:hypothetical protein